MTIFSRALFVLIVAFLTGNDFVSADELRAANIFTDNMVLQREQPVVIWGWGDASEKVTVDLQEQSVTVSANESGKWIATLEPISVGDPFEVKIKGAKKSLLLKNVVAGEVWICSGQSNMEWAVRSAGNPKEEIANGNYPLIRHVKITNATNTQKNTDAANTGWQVCSPQTVANFTAVGYYFGRELHQELDVPIGLINTSWGGTIIEAWISAESLKSHPDFSDVLKEMSKLSSDPAEIKRRADNFNKWSKAFNEAYADRSDPWEKAGLDDSNWKKIKVPGHWEGQGYPLMDGVAWYRHSFSVPAKWIGKKAKISIAMIDDGDTTFLNGEKIGENTAWNKPRVYETPAALLKESNTISIRVNDGGQGGGIHGSSDDVFISIEGEDPISLAGEWKFKPSSKTEALGPKPEVPFAGPNNPTVLHNAMVHPIVPYSVRGTIWYQGESNAGRAFQYRKLMPMLVKDWRSKWNNEMPFYWVQLANFLEPSKQPAGSTWAELREAQSMALRTPKTGQAVIIDIGEANDIHPKNKQDVGKRLALIALAKDYGKEIEYSGPVYKSISIEGSKVRLSFDHAEGLHAKANAKGETKLMRFEIAGADKKFVWADATVEGNQVIVTNADIKQPVAVRYAWADNPEGCNLYNKAGLPASPFRTDQWKGMTQN
ncbi:MAG: sialate O-acetylesterase [Mariniblastus sp.]